MSGKKVSTRLLNMKFMQRKAVNNKESEEAAAHEKLEKGDGKKRKRKEDNTSLTPNVLGRMSFGNFNPVVEEEQTKRGIETRVKHVDSKTVSEEEMAKRYKTYLKKGSGNDVEEAR
uniref:Uncharacterized protein n=1 Tax=Palpitomonas bilix TaxID=652834 RepID=A0A7S3GKV3_9EUKA|mmetsp:Transcript_7832/g.20337  ORF Transcript_7832/g.20337 Transcript_7832/m.20337 type:complete len:116 (+) Transcript_7832:208-555(+)